MVRRSFAKRRWRRSPLATALAGVPFATIAAALAAVSTLAALLIVPERRAAAAASARGSSPASEVLPMVVSASFDVQRSDERARVFADRFDPRHLRGAAPRRVNDDGAAPETGVRTCPHENVEILADALEGDFAGRVR